MGFQFFAQLFLEGVSPHIDGVATDKDDVLISLLADGANDGLKFRDGPWKGAWHARLGSGTCETA